MRKEEIKKLIEDAGYQVYVMPKNDRYTYFKIVVPVVENGKVTMKYIVPNDNVCYYSHKKGCYWCTAYGTDRVFEIIYSLSMWLFNDGYKINYSVL